MGGGEEEEEEEEEEKAKDNNPFLSESFAPLDALKDETLLAPSKTLFDDESYPLFDHIGKCRFMLPKNHPDFFDEETKLALPKQSEESKQKQVRRRTCCFLQSFDFFTIIPRADARTHLLCTKKQEAFKARAMRLKELDKKFSEREHAVEVIASRFKAKGPLSMLYRALHENKRVKIVTRNDKGVRGCMECNISAFDKYFNFVAHDIEETYTVRVRKEKEYVNGNGQTKTRRRRVTEHRERKLSQMFLRGESVVLVSLAEENDDDEEDGKMDTLEEGQIIADGDEDAATVE
tara:strand:- start:284 stop:1156 length:873 start_codon:yes stop_codon:yes gene_type:complete